MSHHEARVLGRVHARVSFVARTLHERSWLAAITAAGFMIRVAFAIRSDGHLLGDPLYYHLQANLLARGKGFLDASAFYYQHHSVPGADHPPLQTLWLSLWSAVGLHTVRWHLVAGAVMGAVTIMLISLAAEAVAGKGAAIAAGIMAALWPNLIFWCVGGYAESIAAAAVALYCLLGVRYLRRPSLLGLVAVGVAAALAGLARSELILLLAGVVPLALAAHPLTRVTRVRWVGTAVAAAVLVVLPWTVYNATRFDEPVPLSTGLGLVLVSSNCDNQYYGPSIGYWSFKCSVAGQAAARSASVSDRSTRDLRMRSVATDYAADHPSRLPAVMAARLGRAFGVFQPWNSVTLGLQSDQIDPWVGGGIETTWWLGMGLAIAGAVLLRRSGRHLSPFLTPVVVLAITAVASYGSVRFRAPTEPAVLVLAGVALEQGRRHYVRIRVALAAQPTVVVVAEGAAVDGGE